MEMGTEIEPTTGELVEVLTSLVRQLPLGRWDFHGTALVLEHDGKAIWTLTARGVTLAASSLMPAGSAPAPAAWTCISCGTPLASRDRHYCDPCRHKVARRRAARMHLAVGKPVTAR
jgi:hypothetical protein